MKEEEQAAFSLTLLGCLYHHKRMQHVTIKKQRGTLLPWIILFPVFLLVSLIGVVASFKHSQSVVTHAAQSSPSADSLPTYFSYQSTDLPALQVYASPLRMSSSEVYQLQQHVLAVVKHASLPPTSAAEVYAAVSVAQLDAAALSLQSRHVFMGSLIPVTAQTVCLYVPDECRTMRLLEPEDTYSQVLATLVVDKLQQRRDTDRAQRHVYPALTGESYWSGTNPTTPDAGSWLPWNISNVVQFRAVAPPRYGSAEDLQQVAQVKAAVGAVTPDQKEKILYWAGGMGTVTPAGIWMQITDDYLQSKQESLENVLITHALVATTVEDAFISCWDNKFTYWVKRPFMRDPAIVPVIKTPNFPSYVSGHSMISAAAATVLGALYPEHAHVWLDMATEAKNTRLWSGIHFPMDNEEGFRMGQSIARVSLQKAEKLRAWIPK